MNLKLRRIGNSIGVIIPGNVLRDWALSEGDSLELTAEAIRPPRGRRNHQEQLDRLKHALAVEVVKQHSAEQIRRHSIDNLVRWRSAGVWGPAYQRWFDVLSSADDGALYALMVGHDEEANRLRQSPPFVGLLPQPVLEELRAQATR